MATQKKGTLKKFIEKRIPRQTRMTLDHSRLFIVPTGFGFSLLLMIVLLFILGTNYQNNPILIVSYLLFTWLFGAMYLCFFNLNGATLALTDLPDTVSGEPFSMLLHLGSKKDRHNWIFSLPDRSEHCVFDVKANTTFTVPCTAKRRGHQQLGDIRLQSRYPFGLFRCWTFLRFSNKQWVYPSPLAEPWQLGSATAGSTLQNHIDSLELDTSTKQSTSDMDFDELRTYQVGQPLSRVSWKHQAKNPDADWLVKQYSNNDIDLKWLSLSSLSGHDLEQNLSILCFACFELTKQDAEFGLALTSSLFGNKIIMPNRGEAHLTECLKALALYGLTSHEA
ncbi:DUF58 domain-containing protein [Psychrosphaera sp. 1_MG-2023]|uniref:DUF58 domain-containing protein n=1 Tax=Psychrosphaera sp. 1_MG-2023 TaxID=3062643 RepID=UPI0026E1655D|nr:DUF58 domain-containing protein [Psychrosphaera sp. 1_MG-2023]MDO6720414.1 DUF58 domain-containing protein [Psychrosphaera sp. 1_MG-2023]